MPADLAMKVSVVIPVRNAARFLPGLFHTFETQQPSGPTEIILVDSHSTDSTVSIARTHPRVAVHSIDRFTHGAARNLGTQHATGDILVFMTQDAVPANNHWLAELLAPFQDTSVAASYSRQIPQASASPMERHFLSVNFPDTSCIRQKPPNHNLNLDDFKFSNVSSAIRRDIALRFPFDETLIMSEDQQFARDILQAGYRLAYQSSSIVVHSHEYGLLDTFRRYFDSTLAFRQLAAGYNAATSARQGWNYIRNELVFIAKAAPHLLPYYCMYNAAKTAGVLAAHLEPHLTRQLCRRFSLQSDYWRAP